MSQAVSFLTVLLFRPEDRPLTRATVIVLVLQVSVGLLGFWLHVRANALGGMEGVRDRFIHGAPAFAPLLFANLSLLAGLGIWELQASRLAPTLPVEPAEG